MRCVIQLKQNILSSSRNHMTQFSSVRYQGIREYLGLEGSSGCLQISPLLKAGSGMWSDQNTQGWDHMCFKNSQGQRPDSPSGHCLHCLTALMEKRFCAVQGLLLFCFSKYLLTLTFPPRPAAHRQHFLRHCRAALGLPLKLPPPQAEYPLFIGSKSTICNTNHHKSSCTQANFS